MKYLVIFLVLIGMSAIAYAEDIPVEIQTPNNVDLIITGMMEMPVTNEDPIVIIIIENKTGYPILLASTSPDEKGYFSLDVKRQGPLWDGVTEFSVTAQTAKDTSDVNAIKLEYGVYNVGTISWTEASYSGFEDTTGTIQVFDPDINQFSNAVDFLRIKVWSDSSPTKTTLTLTETGVNTNTFEGDVIFSNKYQSSREVVFVSNGDTVTATYADTTLPKDMKSNVYHVNATALIVGKRGPPMERAPASNLQIFDTDKKPILGNEVLVNQQISLVSDLANQQNKSQPFAYLVQILNNQDKVESLSWITGNLTSFQKLNPGITWIPFEKGKFTATVFVWESVNNPTALSPPVQIEFTVKEIHLDHESVENEN
ncbi:hypothetical protein [Nitrosarchaeum sp. AC2]|uniref:hypothetical protein n=1 Tax=Nitrosarchaeum sp. AC2 TaxID=2259673 RepID=UPI0015CD2226|nr:hypothetical protein [Nitrosarchaeum sp. AC2]QLH10855.1 hypothetical protein DSQ20_04740 [Nitrosarchaeum sp. AC2]